MKKIIILLLCILAIKQCMAQNKATKPKLMVVPDDNWCILNGYYTSIDNAGRTKDVADYEKAFQRSTELGAVVKKINSIFSKRGFDLEDMAQTMSNDDVSAAEDAASDYDRQNAGKSGLASSGFDRINALRKYDIRLALNWKVETKGPYKYVWFGLEAKDAYTGKSVGAASGESEPSSSATMMTLLEEAVLKHIDNFQAAVMRHFDDLLANGREIIIEVNKAGDVTTSFEDEYNGEELRDLIKSWVQKNTVKGRYSLKQSTASRLLFDQVRIPLFNENGESIDAGAFGKQMKKFLAAAPFNLPTRYEPIGLGRVRVLIDKK